MRKTPSVASVSAKPVIGIIGGVGAGKSTIASELAKLGCAVVNADVVGHEVIDRDDVKAELRELWGAGVFDAAGEVDRPAVAARVFAHEAELAKLNAVMHPRMRVELARRIERLAALPAVEAVVLDAAVLLEAGWDDLCTAVVFVDAGDDLRARRVSARGWDEQAWRRREKSQKTLDIKRSNADHVIDNSSSLASLRERVRSLLHTLLHTTDRFKDR